MTATILIVDDEENARINISTFLAARGYETISVATLSEAREYFRLGNVDIILLDAQLPDGHGPAFLEETALLPWRPPIILITAYGDIDMAVDAMKNGAHDFLQKPIHLSQLEKSIKRAEDVVAIHRELDHYHKEQQNKYNFIVGKSVKMSSLLEIAIRAAQASASVLLTGETGTGKEILANAIHQLGPRSKKPFIAINCAAIQSTVLESELFGYEPGAFTGAEKRKLGLMEVADDGVLFLDEISSMPIDMQVKLLRALDEHSFRRVGGTNLIHVNVQVLAASNRNLPALIEQGNFRDDLYYRLKVIDLSIPPLRERKEDIPEFVGLFIRNNNMSMGMNVTGISSRAIDALKVYNWPGNIRELRNVIERAMLFCDDPKIDLAHLPADIAQLK